MNFEKVAIDDGLYANSSLCYGIGAHINDLIVHRAFKNHYNYNTLVTKYKF